MTARKPCGDHHRPDHHRVVPQLGVALNTINSAATTDLGSVTEAVVTITAAPGRSQALAQRADGRHEGFNLQLDSDLNLQCYEHDPAQWREPHWH